MDQSLRKVALINGATGQDGADLAELLLAKGCVVHGSKRRSSSFNTGRVDHLDHDPQVSRLSALRWKAHTPLRVGLARSYADFLARVPIGKDADDVSY